MRQGGCRTREIRSLYPPLVPAEAGTQVFSTLDSRVRGNERRTKRSPNATGAVTTSGAAAPQAAIAAGDEGQAGRVARPVLVAFELELLLGRLPAFSLARQLLHVGRGQLIQLEDI